jgi:hypothetical protein
MNTLRRYWDLVSAPSSQDSMLCVEEVNRQVINNSALFEAYTGHLSPYSLPEQKD